MEDTRQCCNPFPCSYIGKDKTCEECNCYRNDYWDENERQPRFHKQKEKKMTTYQLYIAVLGALTDEVAKTYLLELYKRAEEVKDVEDQHSS